jgi:hypothetical protein
MACHKTQVGVCVVEQFPWQMLPVIALHHERQRALGLTGGVKRRAYGVNLQACRFPEEDPQPFEEP